MYAAFYFCVQNGVHYTKEEDTVMSSFTQFDAECFTFYDREASDVLGKDYWRVLVGFRYYLGDGSGHYVVIEPGYLSDGASVPRIFWSSVPPWGRYGQAVVLHDKLCETLTVYTRDGKPYQITRKRADEIFNEAMGVLNVPSYTRKKIYTAVSLYRTISGTDNPNPNPVKLRMERSWLGNRYLAMIREILNQSNSSSTQTA